MFLLEKNKKKKNEFSISPIYQSGLDIKSPKETCRKPIFPPCPNLQTMTFVQSNDQAAATTQLELCLSRGRCCNNAIAVHLEFQAQQRDFFLGGGEFQTRLLIQHWISHKLIFGLPSLWALKSCNCQAQIAWTSHTSESSKLMLQN